MCVCVCLRTSGEKRSEKKKMLSSSKISVFSVRPSKSWYISAVPTKKDLQAWKRGLVFSSRNTCVTHTHSPPSLSLRSTWMCVHSNHRHSLRHTHSNTHPLSVSLSLYLTRTPVAATVACAAPAAWVLNQWSWELDFRWMRLFRFVIIMIVLHFVRRLAGFAGSSVALTIYL